MSDKPEEFVLQNKKDKWYIDKRIWNLLILFILMIIVNVITFSSKYTIRVNTFDTDTDPIHIGGSYVKLNCTSKNTDFLTVDSHITCNVSLISENIKYATARVNIIAFDLENPFETLWDCYALIYDFDNTSYKPAVCKNTIHDNSFKPKNVGSYKFGISSFEAHQYFNMTGMGINYEGREIFSTTMNIMSKNEAFISTISYRAYILSNIAILLTLIGSVIKIRDYLKED